MAAEVHAAPVEPQAPPAPLSRAVILGAALCGAAAGLFLMMFVHGGRLVATGKIGRPETTSRPSVNDNEPESKVAAAKSHPVTKHKRHKMQLTENSSTRHHSAPKSHAPKLNPPAPMGGDQPNSRAMVSINTTVRTAQNSSSAGSLYDDARAAFGGVHSVSAATLASMMPQVLADSVRDESASMRWRIDGLIPETGGESWSFGNPLSSDPPGSVGWMVGLVILVLLALVVVCMAGPAYFAFKSARLEHFRAFRFARH